MPESPEYVINLARARRVAVYVRALLDVFYQGVRSRFKKVRNIEEPQTTERRDLSWPLTPGLSGDMPHIDAASLLGYCEAWTAEHNRFLAAQSMQPAPKIAVRLAHLGHKVAELVTTLNTFVVQVQPKTGNRRDSPLVLEPESDFGGTDPGPPEEPTP